MPVNEIHATHKIEARYAVASRKNWSEVEGRGRRRRKDREGRRVLHLVASIGNIRSPINSLFTACRD